MLEEFIHFNYGFFERGKIRKDFFEHRIPKFDSILDQCGRGYLMAMDKKEGERPLIKDVLSVFPRSDCIRLMRLQLKVAPDHLAGFISIPFEIARIQEDYKNDPFDPLNIPFPIAFPFIGLEYGEQADGSSGKFDCSLKVPSRPSNGQNLQEVYLYELYNRAIRAFLNRGLSMTEILGNIIAPTTSAQIHLRFYRGRETRELQKLEKDAKWATIEKLEQLIND